MDSMSTEVWFTLDEGAEATSFSSKSDVPHGTRPCASAIRRRASWSLSDSGLDVDVDVLDVVPVALVVAACKKECAAIRCRRRGN